MAQQYRSSRSRGGGSGRSRSGSGGGSRGGSRDGGGQGGRSGGRPSGRGGGRSAPARSGGGNGPMVAAIVLVVGVIGLLVFLTSGKGKNDRPKEHVTKYPPMTGQSPGTSETEPAKPPPYPEINMDLKKQAMALAEQAKELAKKGEAVYDEAVAARHDSDDDLWQKKLEEASEYFYEIRELWNEFIAQMPTNEHYDEEDVANHYFGREGSIVSTALSRLTDIKKQRRL